MGSCCCLLGRIGGAIFYLALTNSRVFVCQTLVILPTAGAAHGSRKTDPLSEHPTGDVTDGMNWTVQRFDAIVRGGWWPQTA